MSDYHVHMVPHGPSDDPAPFRRERVEAYVEAAARRGVTEIAITEHLYRLTESRPILGDFWDDPSIPSDIGAVSARFVQEECTFHLDEYVSAIVDAKDAGLPVKLGMEIDFFPESIEAVMGLIEGYPFDVLVGSVHWIGGWAVDSAETQSEFARRGFHQAHADYAAVVAEMAGSGLVDVIGHVDKSKEQGNGLAPSDGDIYQPIVDAAQRSGVAVEINSKGLKRDIAEAYPAPWLLDRFHAQNVPITLSSDGHRTDEVGWGIDQVADLARSAGYASHLRFDRRVSYDVPLPNNMER